MPYLAHRFLTDPARPRSELWRLCLGIVMAVAVMYGITQGLFAIVSVALGDQAALTLAGELERSDTPLGLLALLFMMGAMGIAAITSAEVLHRRSALSLFGPWPLFRAQFLAVLAVLVVLNIAIALLPPWTDTGTLEAGVPKAQWLLLLPLSLTALLIQTGSEELFFRGYLQSQLAARLSHPAVWLILPSALFARGHHAPDLYGANAIWVTLWAFVFGVAMADLTARAGTLGPAVAFHFVNNTLAMAFVSLSGEMSGIALYRYPFGPGDEAAIASYLPIDLALMGVSWLAARLALRR